MWFIFLITFIAVVLVMLFIVFVASKMYFLLRRHNRIMEAEDEVFKDAVKKMRQTMEELE